MMKTFPKFLLVLIMTLSAGCTGKHLINNKEYLAIVEKSFNKRKQLAYNREDELFSVFNQKLSIKQTEALKFLFAYMPLSDLADYNGEFFLENINMSLRAKTETPWGNEIPDEIFLHYVLPCRVNNENLDSFRIVYYDEILNLISGKDIKEAALEINHWCHEKVSYQPADIRTSAPMSTILSARGRCGEESTFTVAALRTAGIPARQVYTPRWAHSDDNHAWVEIWFNGEWFYMGACEPEPVLDRGWFTEPAKRAMLVHTKSFGAYFGTENIINTYNNYTEVNNLAKYAVTKKIYVKVLDKEGEPLNNAKVEFQLYNYAEFYPLAVVPINENGISQFETGLGDLLIWAYKNDDFNYEKISVSETDTLILKLNRKVESNYSFNIDLDVPVIRSPAEGPSQEISERNSEKTNRENIIRQKYIDSWMKPSESKALALRLNLDSVKITGIISRSMGNYNEIRGFLTDTPDSLRNLAISLLGILPDKDLRDMKEKTLSDHLLNSVKSNGFKEQKSDNIFLNYVLNPRIANEIIVNWRSYFMNKLPSQLLDNSANDPALIIKYLNENIKIADDENYYKTPLTPIGVHDLKVSDTFSRSICFVAICRSLGIPSRLEPGRNIPQYYLNDIWNDVCFADQKQPSPEKGFLKLQSSDTKPVPEYYIHFTIARLENGRYNTLEYEFNKKITGFKEELVLPPGNYMLVTGNRINDSKILSGITFFDLSGNEHKSIEVNLRKNMSMNKILGKVDLKNIMRLLNESKSSQVCAIDKGVVIIWIEPDMEPSKHIFNDLPLLKRELDSWGGTFAFLSTSVKDGNSFVPEELKGLPANTFFGTDNQMAMLKNLVGTNLAPIGRLPYVVLTDKDGNILFTSSGYRIGLGEQILKYAR